MNLYIGSKFNQTCDSKGPHNAAEFTDLGNGTTHIKWMATHRENSPDWEHTWGGPYSWDNLYFWCSIPITLPSPFTKFVQMVDFQPLQLANWNTTEFEVHAVPLPCEIDNIAWQFLQVSPYRVSTFNFGHGWEESFRINAAPLKQGEWTRFTSVSEITPKGPHHLGIQWDSNYRPVDIQRPWVPSDKDGDKKTHVNFAGQIGSLNKGTVVEAIVALRLVIM